MRTNEQRADKFAGKCVGNDVKNRIDAHRDEQISNYRSSIGDLVFLEHAIKQIISDKILPAHRPYYIIFGKELYSLKNRFRGQIFYNEMILLEQKWVDRGLDFMILDDIKRLFWPTYPETKYFLTDDSLLDGEDRLA